MHPGVPCYRHPEHRDIDTVHEETDSGGPRHHPDEGAPRTCIDAAPSMEERHSLPLHGRCIPTGGMLRPGELMRPKGPPHCYKPALGNRPSRADPNVPRSPHG